MEGEVACGEKSQALGLKLAFPIARAKLGFGLTLFLRSIWEFGIYPLGMPSKVTNICLMRGAISLGMVKAHVTYPPREIQN